MNVSSIPPKGGGRWGPGPNSIFEYFAEKEDGRTHKWRSPGVFLSPSPNFHISLGSGDFNHPNWCEVDCVRCNGMQWRPAVGLPGAPTTCAIGVEEGIAQASLCPKGDRLVDWEGSKASKNQVGFFRYRIGRRGGTDTTGMKRTYCLASLYASNM